MQSPSPTKCAMLAWWLLAGAWAGAEEAYPRPDPATATPSEHGRYRAAYASTLQPLAINRMHAWVIQLHDADGAPVEDAELRVSGGMPAHDHGLPTAPRATTNLGGGRYLIEGMKFHMGGVWNIVVHIEATGGADTIIWDIRI